MTRWNPNLTYLPGTEVADLGHVYRAKINVPKGILLTNTAYWTSVSDVTPSPTPPLIPSWSNTDTYAQNALVFHEGLIWRATTTTIGSEPAQDSDWVAMTGTSPTLAQVLQSGNDAGGASITGLAACDSQSFSVSGNMGVSEPLPDSVTANRTVVGGLIVAIA